jgi:hypothetical protein
LHCPNCGGEYRDGFTECADCKVPLVTLAPGEVPRHVSVPTFPTIPDHRPKFLRVMQFLAFSCGAVSLVIALTILKGALAGEEESSDLRLFLIGLPLLGVAGASFAVAFSISRDARWSRHLLIALLAAGAIFQTWVAPRASLVLFSSVDTGLFCGLAILGLAFWYLYWKQNVRDYYAGLGSKSEEPLATQDEA